MKKRISINPITRLEGHGQIHIDFDAAGHVARTYFQIPDFKGFEKFCEGRAVEEMPTLTQKICGVCPTAHHIAGSKALDRIFDVKPPPAARLIRELMHNAFIFEDHLLHLYYLGGPDLLVGAEAPPEKRNIFGVIHALGQATGKRLITIRKRVRQLNSRLGGSALYPVNGLPGGVAQPVESGLRAEIVDTVKEAVAFAEFSLALFDARVWHQAAFKDLLQCDNFNQPTYYLGMVDQNKQVNFYDGKLRIVDPDGKEYCLFEPREYTKHLAERVDTWSYLKMLYLQKIGWHGLIPGNTSGVYRVGPLARLNASEGMATPKAQQEYTKMMATMGGKPVHNTLAYHRARLVEVLYAAERMMELANDDRLFQKEVRRIPEQFRLKGVGACEAPRGTLIHDYSVDRRLLVDKMNLIVATQHNAAAICLDIDRAARAFIDKDPVTDSTLNRVEMAYRAYDPCMACATH
jgi:F420-non-reducing hydrogenase large subunit